jgi:hypothetical protein
MTILNILTTFSPCFNNEFSFDVLLWNIGGAYPQRIGPKDPSLVECLRPHHRPGILF